MTLSVSGPNSSLTAPTASNPAKTSANGTVVPQPGEQVVVGQTAVLARLSQLQMPVDAFFDNVLVNADDQAVRANRLALLGQLKAQFSAIADIALL